MLVQKEYKGRHGKKCLNIHWALCKKYVVNVCGRWYKHKVESVIENDNVKILWISVLKWIDKYNIGGQIVVVEKNKKNV